VLAAYDDAIKVGEGRAAAPLKADQRLGKVDAQLAAQRLDARRVARQVHRALPAPCRQPRSPGAAAGGRRQAAGGGGARTVGRPAAMGGTLTLPRASLGTTPSAAAGGTHASVCHSPYSVARSAAAGLRLNSSSSEPPSPCPGRAAGCALLHLRQTCASVRHRILLAWRRPLVSDRHADVGCMASAELPAARMHTGARAYLGGRSGGLGLSGPRAAPRDLLVRRAQLRRPDLPARGTHFARRAFSARLPRNQAPRRLATGAEEPRARRTMRRAARRV